MNDNQSLVVFTPFPTGTPQSTEVQNREAKGCAKGFLFEKNS